MPSNILPFRRADGPCFEVKAKAEDRGEVWLYGVIGGDWFDDGPTAKGFAEEMKKLSGVKTLDIFINSPGGSVFEGVAIHNILARHAARKIVHVDALAASIASVIAMAGDEILIAENGLMMIHDPWSIAAGTATDFRKMADSLDKIRDAILATYIGRTGGDAGEVSALMAAETWFNADEAIAAGFATGKTEAVQVAAFAGIDLSILPNSPDQLRAAVDAAAAVSEPKAVSPDRAAKLRQMLAEAEVRARSVRKARRRG